MEAPILSVCDPLRRDLEVGHGAGRGEPLARSLLLRRPAGSRRNNSGSDAVFIDEVHEHVTENISLQSLDLGAESCRGDLVHLKRGRHLHWRVPAMLLPWAVFHLSNLAQMRAISKPLLESDDDVSHDAQGHTATTAVLTYKCVCVCVFVCVCESVCVCMNDYVYMSCVCVSVCVSVCVYV